MTTKNKTATQLMRDNQIVKMYAGSIAYGTNLPTSDVDFRGLFFADPINIITPYFNIKECEDKTEEDTKLFEVGKFIESYTKANPNILELLWTDDKHITFRTPVFDLLQAQREALLSSKVRFTFGGYAAQQLKRIKGHNKSINNPKPVEPPKQTGFVNLVQNFTEAKILSKEFDLVDYKEGRLVPFGGELYGLYPAELHQKAVGYETYSTDFTLNTVFSNESRVDWGAPSMIVKYVKEDYDRAKVEHSQYWDWKTNRNKARSVLEEEHGYDTKHAMHLVRLLRMCEEILRDGKILVTRADAAELLSIRNGAWTYEELIEWADHMDNDVLPGLYKTTALRSKPDINLAAQLTLDVYEAAWYSK